MAAPFRKPVSRTQIMPKPVGSSGGRYRLSLVSGLLTAVAADNGAGAGILAAFRNSSAAKTILVDKVIAQATMVTDFTTQQRIGLLLKIARAFTANYTGGSAPSLAGNAAKKRTSDPATILGDARIGTTGALGGGTATLDVSPMAAADQGAPADGVAVANLPIELVFNGNDDGPIILAQNEGLVLTNEVLMGAAGTMGLNVTFEWREILNAEVEGF